jgi:hypothetical protein
MLAIDGIAWELLLFHQPTLCISTFIKWFARIAEKMIIVLLFLHCKAMSKISQIPDVATGVFFFTAQFRIAHVILSLM